MALLVMPACFNEEMDLTAYLETDGSVTLQIDVQNVYSLEKSPLKRTKEEHTLREHLLNEEDVPYMDMLYNGGAESVSVVILRDQIPFHYVIRARFSDLDDFLNMLVEDPHYFDVDISLTEQKCWLTITPSGLGTDLNKPGESDDDLEIRLIIANASKIITQSLPHEGTNSVILTPAHLREPIRIEWTRRRQPKSSDKLEE